MANVDWQDWSQFGQAGGRGGTRRASAGPRTSTTTIPGASRSGRRQQSLPILWTWSVGFAYDTSPLSHGQRSPEIPLHRQWRAGTGLSTALDRSSSSASPTSTLNLGDASLSRDRGPVTGKLDGKYATNEVHFVDFTISYKF